MAPLIVFPKDKLALLIHVRHRNSRIRVKHIRVDCANIIPLVCYRRLSYLNLLGSWHSEDFLILPSSTDLFFLTPMTTEDTNAVLLSVQEKLKQMLNQSSMVGVILQN